MDEYQFWRNALAGIEQEVHEGEPHAGFWRWRQKGEWLAVATWVRLLGSSGDGDELIGTMRSGGGGTPHPINPIEDWTFFCQYPVRKEQYDEFRTTGRWWDDPPSTGHNQPPEAETAYETFKRELEAEIETAKSFLGKPIEDQETADMIAVWVKKLLTLEKGIDEERRSVKRIADDEFNPLQDEARALVVGLREILTPWLLAHKDSDGKGRAGRTGETVSLRTYTKIVITDMKKAVLACLDEPEMIALVTKLAIRAEKSGNLLSGTEKEDEERAV